MEKLEFLQYEVKDGVAVISLNRPDKANSQHHPLLHELDGCWRAAEADHDVKVILLRANGRHFSAGHDLTGFGDPEIDRMQAEGTYSLDVHYDVEARVFFGYTLGWRNSPKPSIAAVQGKCVAAGLMLCWPCDLIIAADNAEFSDPVLQMQLFGIEYHAHAWEMGPRKAKELLLLGHSITAQQAYEVGMVNKVVPLDELDATALQWATRIAHLDPWLASQVKRTINNMQDVQGYTTTLRASFDVHELSHGVRESKVKPAGEGEPSLLETMRSTNRSIASA
jgi:enoyl-CoA hydratase